MSQSLVKQLKWKIVIISFELELGILMGGWGMVTNWKLIMITIINMMILTLMEVSNCIFIVNNGNYHYYSTSI